MRKLILKKFLSWVTLVAFVTLSVGPSCAQGLSLGVGAGSLSEPGVMVNLSPSFHPAILQGIKIDPNDPMKFDFILDPGDVGNGRDRSVQDESLRLVRYFLAALTVPENDLWVNLSPYEKDRIITNEFGQTEMGRDLLAQDYLLKQITASVIYPEGETGKKFWAEVYQKAQEKYGTTDIPVDTFNKVWIVPAEAVVYENAKARTAYVVESRLKVMLETDYLLAQKVEDGRSKAEGKDVDSLSFELPPSTSSDLAKNILREIVIPILEKEVNEGENFAKLRQVYHSLILASWYKRKIKDSILAQVYVDQKKMAGLEREKSQNVKRSESQNEPERSDVLTFEPLQSQGRLLSDSFDDSPESIWRQYVEAFKKGVFNYVKEERDQFTDEMIPRKYFSGGVVFNVDKAMKIVEVLPASLRALVLSSALLVVGVGCQTVYSSSSSVSGVQATTIRDPGTVVIQEASVNMAQFWDEVRSLPNGDVMEERLNKLIRFDGQFSKISTESASTLRKFSSVLAQVRPETFELFWESMGFDKKPLSIQEIGRSGGYLREILKYYDAKSQGEMKERLGLFRRLFGDLTVDNVSEKRELLASFLDKIDSDKDGKEREFLEAALQEFPELFGLAPEMGAKREGIERALEKIRSLPSYAYVSKDNFGQPQVLHDFRKGLLTLLNFYKQIVVVDEMKSARTLFKCLFEAKISSESDGINADATLEVGYQIVNGPAFLPIAFHELAHNLNFFASNDKNPILAEFTADHMAYLLERYLGEPKFKAIVDKMSNVFRTQMFFPRVASIILHGEDPLREEHYFARTQWDEVKNIVGKDLDWQRMAVAFSEIEASYVNKTLDQEVRKFLDGDSDEKENLRFDLFIEELLKHYYGQMNTPKPRMKVEHYRFDGGPGLRGVVISVNGEPSRVVIFDNAQSAPKVFTYVEKSRTPSRSFLAPYIPKIGVALVFSSVLGMAMDLPMAAHAFSDQRVSRAVSINLKAERIAEKLKAEFPNMAIEYDGKGRIVGLYFASGSDTRSPVKVPAVTQLESPQSAIFDLETEKFIEKNRSDPQKILDHLVARYGKEIFFSGQIWHDSPWLVVELLKNDFDGMYPLMLDVEPERLNRYSPELAVMALERQDGWSPNAARLVISTMRDQDSTGTDLVNFLSALDKIPSERREVYASSIRKALESDVQNYSETARRFEIEDGTQQLLSTLSPTDPLRVGIILSAAEAYQQMNILSELAQRFPDLLPNFKRPENADQFAERSGALFYEAFQAQEKVLNGRSNKEDRVSAVDRTDRLLRYFVNAEKLPATDSPVYRLLVASPDADLESKISRWYIEKWLRVGDQEAWKMAMSFGQTGNVLQGMGNAKVAFPELRFFNGFEKKDSSVVEEPSEGDERKNNRQATWVMFPELDGRGSIPVHIVSFGGLEARLQRIKEVLAADQSQDRAMRVGAKMAPLIFAAVLSAGGSLWDVTEAFAGSKKVKPAAVKVQQRLAQKSQVSFVGMYHEGYYKEDSRELQERLVRLASQGKIFLGIEGLVRDPKVEETLVKDVYGRPKGLVFGYEDDFALNYTGMLLNYGYVTNERTESKSSKAVFISNIRESASVAQAWGKMSGRPLSQPVRKLYDKITVYMSKPENASLKDLIRNFDGSFNETGSFFLRLFSNDDGWQGLFQEMILIMTETALTLPDELRPDIAKVKDFLRDPQSEASVKFVTVEMNREWRGEYIRRNMKMIVRIANEGKLPVYFLIGADHLPDVGSVADGGHFFENPIALEEKDIPSDHGQSSEDLGGIDLNPTDQTLQINGSGQALKFNIDPAMFRELQNAPGITPVIINVTPLGSLPDFLGLDANGADISSG